jgi:thiol-disulfide isomerase/thioredoxin
VFNKLRQQYKTKKYLRFILQLLLLLMFVTGLHYWQSRNLMRGPAPLIVDQLLTSERFDLADYHGQPVFVYFWAPWCPLCKLQGSSIESIARDYRVISIAAWAENKAEVMAYMQQRNLNFPVIVDEQGEWAAVYGVKAVPAGFFLDKEAGIYFVESGYTTEIGLRLRLWWLENL